MYHVLEFHESQSLDCNCPFALVRPYTHFKGFPVRLQTLLRSLHVNGLKVKRSIALLFVLYHYRGIYLPSSRLKTATHLHPACQGEQSKLPIDPVLRKPQKKKDISTAPCPCRQKPLSTKKS